MGTWLIRHRALASNFLVALLGAVAWSGHDACLALSFGFLPLFLLQANRWAAYKVALAYYAGATWPLVPGANTFFRPHHPFWLALMLWLTASVFLAIPWGLFHFRSWPACFWSVPLALAATSLPPLGLIGWASPLTSAGILFPGTGWLGISAVLLLPWGMTYRPRVGLPLGGALVVLANVIYPGDPPPRVTWEAVNTTFGRSELEHTDPILEFQHADWIQQRALSSSAKVIVFPETAVPRWNDATEAFWEPTLLALGASGKTIVFGATVPLAASSQRFNAVIVRGASEPTLFCQRIPVPISMWKPLSQDGFPLHLTGRGSLGVAGERVAVLICYELLLTWPLLTVSLERPTILIGLANDYWASQTCIPTVQHSALTAWARLFRLPKLMAVNT
jgi:hypothetical protein